MRIFIDGEAGTTGLQLRDRLMAEPAVELLHLDEARRKNPEARAEMLHEADLAVLCLPDEAAVEAVALAGNSGARILDASCAHRTAENWIWGMEEWSPTQSTRIAEARFVSNPGCYATGAVSLLRPLTAAGILSADAPVIINAISGYSGGGRQMIDAYESGTAPPAELYALDLKHKHIEEIRVHGGLTETPLLTPFVGNFRQGMIVALPLFTGWLKDGGAAVEKTLAEWYETSTAISFLGTPPDRLDASALAGSDEMELYCTRRGEQILLIARLDNLGKGAAGAAVQNIRLMMRGK